MKILWIFNHPAPYKVQLFNEIAKFVDLEVVFERTGEKSRPSEYYSKNVYNFKHYFFKHGYFGERNTFSGALKKFVKKNYSRFDLIVMNGYSTVSEMKTIKYLNKHHIQFVFYINGGIYHKSFKLKENFKRKLLKEVKYCFSPSEQADEYLKHFIPEVAKIYHYTYSTLYQKDVIETPLTKEEKAEIRKEYNLSIDKQLFVNASLFIERKNNLQLIEIFKELPDKQLVLIGAGKEESKYRELIEKENIKNVTILGFKEKDELFKILKACDCFITLSKEDIYGHTINEALANGLPIIASDRIIGAKHLIKQGVNGFVVPLESNEIIKAISFIKEDMSVEAIKTAKENTLEKSAENHLTIFKELYK